jgi:hypothetical protein
MGRRSLVSLALLLCAEATLAQVATTSSTSTSTINTSLPVAYVYVSSTHYIHAYKAWVNGTYTSITGSPFPFAGTRKMSVTKSFLFGADGTNLVSYSIHSNGSISKLSSIKPAIYEGSNCDQTGFGTQVDYSQATLYYQACASGFNANQYLSFHIQSNGSLQFLGGSGGSIGAATQGTPVVLTKMGGNPFAFDSYCDDETDQGVIQIFKRQSNGNLIFYGESNSMPAAAPGSAFCMGPVAADSSNHLAAAVFRIDSQPHDAGFIYGPSFLASYTSDANGNLTTTSNVNNMPSLPVAGNNGADTISISPDAKYVAVGGSNGFQVLHFNGGNPPTNFSPAPPALLPGHYIQKFGWDKVHHLYVLSAVYGVGTYTTYLSVFNVTSSGVQKVSGSPHYIANLTNLIVLDLQ